MSGRSLNRDCEVIAIGTVGEFPFEDAATRWSATQFVVSPPPHQPSGPGVIESGKHPELRSGWQIHRCSCYCDIGCIGSADSTFSSEIPANAGSVQFIEKIVAVEFMNRGQLADLSQTH
jgi:hypothetical protein